MPARAKDPLSVLTELERRDHEVGKVEPGASFEGLEEGEGLIECLTSFVHASHEHEHPAVDAERGAQDARIDGRQSRRLDAGQTIVDPGFVCPGKPDGTTCL